jgi:hypothetical protein
MKEYPSLNRRFPILFTFVNNPENYKVWSGILDDIDKYVIW